MSNKKPESISFSELSDKIAKLLKNNSENSLEAVYLDPIKTSESGYYYSPSKLSFVYIPQQAELYKLPVPHSDPDKIYLYSPYNFRNGIIISVDKDSIISIGEN